MNENNSTNTSTQKNHYFEFRNVDPSMYAKSDLPAWIKNELDSNDLKILDYGCGFGQNLSALRDEGFNNIYGVDIENTAIEFCKKNNLQVEQLDLNNLANPYDSKFDVVILTHIIEHIPKEEIIDTLKFIRTELLNENGKALIAVPNAQSNTGCYWRYEDWTHYTLFTAGSLFYVLKAAGFQNVSFLDIDCTMDMRSQWKKLVKKTFLIIYKLKLRFWNAITSSAFHKPSEQIFSYEIKCKAS